MIEDIKTAFLWLWIAAIVVLVAVLALTTPRYEGCTLVQSNYAYSRT